MTISTLAVCTLLLSVASAFKDTSPAFIFSTSKLSGLDSTPSQLARSADVLSHIQTVLRTCPSSSYVVVSQPGVSAADFSGRQSPHLRQWVKREDKRIASSHVVSDVIGGLDAEQVTKVLEDECKAVVTDLDAKDGYIGIDDVLPRIIRIRFPALVRGSEDRTSQLHHHDSYLNAVISALHDDKFTVIYTTSPSSDTQGLASQPAGQIYEMDEPFPSVLHTELKRDFSSHVRDDSGGEHADVGLFEKYQFLSPGIFMGGLVALVLLSILYVGMNALSSLEVSYGAFSKEMGPSAQKKQ